MHLLTMLLAVTFLLCQQSFNKIFVGEISLRDPLIYVLLITHRQSIKEFFSLFRRYTAIRFLL